MRFPECLQHAAWLVLFLPFWLFDRLLRKSRMEQRGYGEENSPAPGGF